MMRDTELRLEALRDALELCQNAYNDYGSGYEAGVDVCIENIKGLINAESHTGMSTRKTVTLERIDDHFLMDISSDVEKDWSFTRKIVMRDDLFETLTTIFDLKAGVNRGGSQ